MHDEALERRRHLDLTGKTRRRAHLDGEVQHVLFHRRRLADFFGPGVIDIDMTGGTGAGTAALGIDPGLRATGYSIIQGDRSGCRLRGLGRSGRPSMG